MQRRISAVLSGIEVQKLFGVFGLFCFLPDVGHALDAMLLIGMPLRRKTMYCRTEES